MSTIYLIRYGQASFGEGDYDKLSLLGVDQSRRLGESLRARLPRVDTVICGSLHPQFAWALTKASVTKLIIGRHGLRLSTLNEHLEGVPSLLTYR